MCVGCTHRLVNPDLTRNAIATQISSTNRIVRQGQILQHKGDLDFMVPEIQSTFCPPLVAIPDPGAQTYTQFPKSSRNTQNYFKKYPFVPFFEPVN